jgi:hypothetical protein
MAKENGQLTFVLDREFERIREIKKNPKFCKSSREMAEFLGIPSSTMSHYRKSNRFIGRTTAREMAERLRSDELGGDANQRAELAVVLFAARSPEADSEAQAQDWLKNIGKPGHLLLVEFRDYPSARPTNPNKEVAKDMAKEAGQAVARGLAYALLNPFPDTFANHPLVNTYVKSHLNLLTDAITETYQRILEEAYRQVIVDNSGAEASVLKDALNRVRNRLRVYRWRAYADAGDHVLTSCPGLGYKLFYHRDGEKGPELWQWLSTNSGEMLLEKTSDEVEIAAIESSFYPIQEYFEEAWCNDIPSLPTTEEMEKYAGQDLKESFWIEVQAISQDMNEKLIEKATRRTP